MKQKTSGDNTSQFEKALHAANLKIFRYDPSKSRAITINSGGTLSLERFMKKIATTLGPRMVDYPEVFRAAHDAEKMQNLVSDFAEKSGALVAHKQTSVSIPESYKQLTLNLDQSHNGRDTKFFMTTPKEYISHVSGNVYLKVLGMKEDEAINVARKVVPEYRPRDKPGVVEQTTINDETIPVYNNYIPPAWMTYEGKLPDKLPALFEKLVNHLFPLKIEREYFYAWLHASLFNRAFVYLILCGPGGTGKNRLKIVLRALHGHQNTVDGKRSTLKERFNSQLGDCTLAWFDELSYDLETENVMKEIQNDSISIERKGVDATRSTKIYASLAISNNKPRDNYIAFDARKFVPLEIAKNRLDSVMTEDEIEELTNKVSDWSSETFDIKFVAQIGRWVKKHGASKKWHHLEYKGPMFYKLAHTSMSRWQKKAATVLLEGASGLNSGRVVYDKSLGYLWSTVAEFTHKKNGDRSMQYPDFSTVRNFFNIFVDSDGKPAFKTTAIPKNMMGDFYVRVLNPKAKILTESEVNMGMGEDDEEETLDL